MPGFYRMIRIGTQASLLFIEKQRLSGSALRGVQTQFTGMAGAHCMVEDEENLFPPIETSCTIEIALTFSFSATGRLRWPPHSGFIDSKTGQRHWIVKCHPALTIGYKAAERERSAERPSQPRGKTGGPWGQPRKGNGCHENGLLWLPERMVRIGVESSSRFAHGQEASIGL